MIDPANPFTLHAIPTRYRGCHFRSRLEARWAIVFDHLDLLWEYELEGFSLPSGYYLPDFWIPKYEYWVEIKPTNTDVDSRWRELVEATGHDMFIFYGTPGVSRRRGFITRGFSGNIYDFSDDTTYPACTRGLGTLVTNPRISAAYDAARSARFEHGQSGT